MGCKCELLAVRQARQKFLARWSDWLVRCDAYGSTFRTEPSVRTAPQMPARAPRAGTT